MNQLLTPWRFTADQYQRMGETGILHEDEPDISILRDRADFYASGPAGPADVLLLVEVSDSSLAYDRGVKLPLYAAAGIPEVWILNLPDGWIERASEPSGARYLRHEILRRGGALSPLALPDVIIAVDALLG